MASAYPNEVGPHNPELQLRYLNNPVAQWSGRFLDKNRLYPVPEFHLDLYDAYVTLHRGVIKAPRSFAKTTTIENYILYLACEHSALEAMSQPPVYPHAKVFGLSETGPKAEEILRHVKTELEENPLILAHYGELQPPATSKKKWTERLIQTRQGFEFKVGGAGCQVRGFRPTMVLTDDIESDKHVRSEDQRAFLEDWLDGPVLGMLDQPWSQYLQVGTTLHPLCSLNYMARKPNFVAQTYKAYRDGVMQEGHELWPSNWSHSRLQTKLLEVGMRRFQSEYMNNPIVSENPIIVKEWFKPYNPDEIKTFDKTVVTIDPAISKKDQSSETAILGYSTFRDDPERYYLRRNGVFRGHVSAERTIHEAVAMYDMIGASEIQIETVAYQKVLVEWLRRYLNDSHRTIPIIAVTPDKDKVSGATEVGPLFQRGTVYFDFEDQSHQAVMNQLYLFPTDSLDDLVDATVMGLNACRKWRSRPKKSTGPTFMDDNAQLMDEQGKVYG